MQNLRRLNEHLRAVKTIQGLPAFEIPGMLLYYAACDAKVELQLGPTPYVAAVQTRLMSTLPNVPPDAFEHFSHRAVILWQLLKVMHRQETSTPTGDGVVVVDVEHIHSAVRLMQGSIATLLPQSDVISMIRFPQALFDPFNSIAQLRRHKVHMSTSLYGKGLVHDFRLLDSDEETDTSVEDDEAEGAQRDEGDPRVDQAGTSLNQM